MNNKNKWNDKKRCDECKYYKGGLVGSCKKFKIDVMQFNTCDFYKNNQKESATNE